MNKLKNKKSIMLIIIIISILLVPTFYSFTYLKAFWDPYQQLSKVPVAFVNLDQPVVKNGTTYDLGKTIENNLKKNNSVDWNFVDYSNGEQGLEGTKYYAMIVIPKNFSEDIANAQGDGFKKPDIIYKVNQGRNFVFSEISTEVAAKIQNTVAQQVSKATSEALVNSLYSVKAGFKKASTGANDLNSGMDKLSSGAAVLVDGQKSLNNGLAQLNSNFVGSNSKAAQLADGSRELSVGAQQLAQGTDKLSNGAQQLNNGLTELKNRVEQSNGNASVGLSKAANAIDSVSQAVNEAYELMDNAESNMSNGNITKEDLKKLAEAKAILAKVNSSNISQSVAVPLRNSAGSSAALVTAINKLQAGSSSLEAGAEGLKAGANQLAQSSTKLSQGTSMLTSGVALGVSKILSGSNKLQSGTEALKNGINSAKDGTNKLSIALNNGYDNLNKNVNFTADEMGSYISDPIGLKTEDINPTNLYGEGLTPYFVCISLWMGAMYTYFIVVAISRKFTDKFNKKFMKVYGFGIIATLIQGAIMSAVLYFGLSMSTTTPWKFFLFNELVVIAFYTLINGLHYVIAPIMKGTVVVLLVLQLTTCAGIYPIETAPFFYRVVHPFVPMTYAVNGIRMTVSGINNSLFMHNIEVLILFIVIFLLIGYFAGYFKIYRKYKIETKKSELVDEKETFNEYV